MLGADLIGFHTQYYCNNFLETVERAIEARIDWEQLRGHPRAAGRRSSSRSRSAWRPSFVDNPPHDLPRGRSCASSASPAEFLGVGVERLDYTKGLPERFRGHRALLRALSRSTGSASSSCSWPRRAARSIPRYQEIEAEVDAAVRDVNSALRHDGSWRPDPLPEAAPRPPRRSGPSTATPTSAWSRRSTTA